MKCAFIAARHGSYDDSLNLSESGKTQMKQLAEAIQRVINGSDLEVSLLCSTAARAEQGGKILVEILGIPEDRAVFHECLYVDNYNKGDWKMTEELVEKFLQDGKVVVLLSHVDVVPAIARFAARKIGVQGDSIRDVGYGRGWMVTPGSVSIVPQA